MNEGGTGQWIEFGFALGLATHREGFYPAVYVSGDSKRTIFLRRSVCDAMRGLLTAHTLVAGWFPSDREAIEHLGALKVER